MKKPNFRPLGGAIAALLDPILAKRTHVDASLALAWPDLAGDKLAGRTQPLKVTWPQRATPDDPFKPGVLTVACEGAAALDLQYRTSELIERINGFFGYAAIARIRIEQRAIDSFRPREKRTARPVSKADAIELQTTVHKIEDDGLRDALLRLGASVKGEKSHN